MWETYEVIKETPKGYWIVYKPKQGGFYQAPERSKNLRGFATWVSKTSKKRFAYPTKEEALNSFRIRRKRYQEILEARIQENKEILWQLRNETIIL